MNNETNLDELEWKTSTTLEEDGLRKINEDMFLAKSGNKVTLGISVNGNLVTRKDVTLSEAQKLIEKFDLVDTPSAFPDSSTYRDKESAKLVQKLLRQVR